MLDLGSALLFIIGAFPMLNDCPRSAGVSAAKESSLDIDGPPYVLRVIPVFPPMPIFVHCRRFLRTLYILYSAGALFSIVARAIPRFPSLLDFLVSTGTCLQLSLLGTGLQDPPRLR